MTVAFRKRAEAVVRALLACTLLACTILMTLGSVARAEQAASPVGPPSSGVRKTPVTGSVQGTTAAVRATDRSAAASGSVSTGTRNAPATGSAQGAKITARAADRASAAAGPVIVRVFTIRFRNPSDVASLIGPLLSDRGSITTGPSKLRTVTVQDHREVLDRVQELIASYDVPPRNVEFTVTLIMGSRNEEKGQPISKEVRGISEVLPDITRWTDYKTMDSVTIAGSEGSRTTRDLADVYRVEFQLESVSDHLGVIRLNPFSLQKAEKGADGVVAYRPVYITTVNLRNDKLLTIGAAKSETSPKALFLAIKARIEKP